MHEALKLLGRSPVYSQVTGAGHDLRSGKFDLDTLVVQPLLTILGRAG
jgi:hypothetical protein